MSRKEVSRPFLLMTVDVEEDMPGWEVQPVTTTKNVTALWSFGERMKELGIRPTYLCGYPVVTQPESAQALRRLAQETECEIGTHLHAWNTPPFNGERRGEAYYQSELTGEAFREKLDILHEAVTKISGRPPTSYRAGRFGIDGKSLEIVSSAGYRVDSSVIPLSEHRVDGGPDHRKAPQEPYFPSAEDAARRGDLPILEIPLSIGLSRNLPELLQRAYVHAPRWSRIRGLLSKDFLGWVDYAWLYPVRFDAKVMCQVAKSLVAKGNPVLNVFIHSSELIPGASGRVQNEEHVRIVNSRLEELLRFCIEGLNATPLTLTEAAKALGPAVSLPVGRALDGR